MINKSRELIRKIMSMLDSSDLTNTEERKILAVQYCDLCKEYNKMALECQSLLDRKMVIDASRYAERKDLKKTGEILQFPEYGLLKDMCRMYQWEIPEDVRLDIIQNLLKTASGSVDVVRLITQYRQIMRSDDRKEKVLLLRQIYKLDPKQEWKDTLVSFEKEWLDELLAQAKEAILNKNEQLLQETGEILNDPAWVVKAPEAALKKIQSEMDKYQKRVLEERAQTLCNQINDALSSFDFDAMVYGLNKWTNFVKAEQYVVPENLSLQIEDARKWYMEEAAIRARKQQAEELITGLQQALDDEESTLEQLDSFAQKLQMMEWEIPEGTRNRYNNVRTQLLVIRARKQRIMIVSIAAGVILAAGLCVWGVHTLIMAHNEMTWLSKIEKTLQDKEPENGLKLLEELAKKSPELRKRVSILEKENKLNDMKKKHDTQRKLYTEQLAVCREKLLKYQENRQLIKELSTQLESMILDSAMKQEYEKLQMEIETAKSDAAADLLKEYNHDIERIDELRKDFFIALDETNFEKAKKCIVDSVNLRVKLQNMTEIDKNIRAMNQKTLDSVSELDGLLKEHIAQTQKLEKIRFALNAPKQSSDFFTAIKDLFRDYYDNADTKKWRFFKDIYLPYIEKLNQGDLSVLKQFKQPLEELNTEEQTYSNTLTKIRNYFLKLSEEYNDRPLYCILSIDLQYPNIIYGLYYHDSSNLKRKADEKIRFHALKNESPGKSNQYVAQIFFDTNVKALKDQAVAFRIDKETWTGRLLYPEQLNRGVLPGRDALAPHTKRIHSVAAILQEATGKNIEKKLIQSLQIVADGDPAIHPYPQILLIKKLCQALSKVSDSDSAKKLVEYLEEKMKKVDVDWEQSWMMISTELVMAGMKAEPWIKTITKRVAEMKASPHRLNFEFKKEFLTFGFKCAGYLIRENQKWRFVSFNTDLSGKELLILNSDKSGFENIGTFPQCMTGLKIECEEAIIPVFAPSARSLKELETEYLNQAKKDGHTLQYPTCWPKKAGDKK